MRTLIAFTFLVLAFGGASTPYRVDRVSARPNHLYLVCNDDRPHSCLGVEGEPKPARGMGTITDETVPTRAGYPPEKLFWFTDSRGVRYRALGW